MTVLYYSVIFNWSQKDVNIPPKWMDAYLASWFCKEPNNHPIFLYSVWHVYYLISTDFCLIWRAISKRMLWCHKLGTLFCVTDQNCVKSTCLTSPTWCIKRQWSLSWCLCPPLWHSLGYDHTAALSLSPLLHSILMSDQFLPFWGHYHASLIWIHTAHLSINVG